MDSRTRRKFLAVAAVATGGVAGCLGSESSTSRSDSETEGPGRNVPTEQVATDPPILFRRTDADQPPIRLVDSKTDESDRRSRPPEYHPQTTLVDTASRADRLVDDGPDDSDDGGLGDSDTTDLASFVSATDFDTESLYLDTWRIEQCFRLSLCYISWQDDGIRTDYGRVLRPYDEQCGADATVFESRLIRLPVALDADEINGFSSSTSGGHCSRDSEGRRTGSTESRSRTTSSSQATNGSEPQ